MIYVIQLLKIHFLTHLTLIDITETDIVNIDPNMTLDNAINFDLPEDDIRMIDLSVAVVEATVFVIAKEDMANID